MLVFSVSMLLLLVPTNSYAGITSPVSVQCGDMIGGSSQAAGGGPGGSINPGAIILISQIDGSQTLIGSPTGVDSLPGLDFDGAGMLWGVNNIATGGPGATPTSHLVKINPNTGALISTVPITAVTGAPVAIQDLGVQPGTDVLFGTTHILDTGIGGGNLVTINKATGVATSVGLLATSSINSLDFAPDGTLYVANFVATSLDTVNPIDASQLTSVFTGIGSSALGVRGDGTIFISGGFGTGASTILTVNPVDGSTTLIGNGIFNHIVDLTFVDCPVVGGEFLPIETTSLLVAGAQSFSWMIPVVFSILGIGLFVVSRKSE